MRHSNCDGILSTLGTAARLPLFQYSLIIRTQDGLQAKRTTLKCTAFILLVSAIGSLAPKACAQSGEPLLSRTDLVEMALKRNGEYLALTQRIAEAQALLRQAGVRLAPTIEAEVSTGKPLRSPGEEEYSAGYFQPIETAGKRDKRMQVAEKVLELAQAELAEQRRQLAFQIETQYAQAIAAAQKAAALDRVMPLSRQSYMLTEARVKEGDAAPLEQKLFLTELSRSEAQQTTFKGGAQFALLELKKLIGISLSEPLNVRTDIDVDTEVVSTAAEVPSLTELQRIALQNRPDLKLLRLQEDQGAAEANLARAEGRPDLTASVRYVRRSSQFPQLGLNASGAPVPLVDRDNLLAFGLSIPVFTGKRTQGAVDAAKARQSEAQLRREFLESSIPLEVEAAYRQWDAIRRAVSIFSSGVIAQSQENLTVIQESYRLGQLRIIDVLNEQRRLIDTQLAYIDTQAQLAQAVAELERAVGGSVR
jgi:cobalt-zinc-cadmium efflux system outer membrane protein